MVLLRELPGTRVSGAAQWPRPEQAVIQLSLRYRSDDQFWFSVFHEIGHLVAGQKRGVIVEDVFDDEIVSSEGPEANANRFARDSLIPPDEYDRFLAQDDLGQEAVRMFADSLSIAVGIVIGRLQRDRLIPHGHLETLKQRYQFAT